MYINNSPAIYGAIKRLSLCSDTEIEFLRKVNGSAESNKHEPVYIQLQDEKKELFVTKTLGRVGGSKRAVQLSDGHALLIPNTLTDHLDTIRMRWPRMVDEEVQMSEFLAAIGCFSLQMKEVKLFLEKDSCSYIPAYIAQSFETLKHDGVFVVDRKNAESTTLGEASALFKDIQAISDPQNWKPYVKVLMEDIAKLIHYGLPIGGDSFNVALVSDKAGHFNIRYLGFDFSSKQGKINIPVVGQPALSRAEVNSDYVLERAKRAFLFAIEDFFFIVYKAKFCLPQAANRTLEAITEAFSHDLRKAILTFTIN